MTNTRWPVRRTAQTIIIQNFLNDKSSLKSCVSHPVSLSPGPGDVLLYTVYMVPSSSTPDPNEWLVIRLNEKLII